MDAPLVHCTVSELTRANARRYPDATAFVFDGERHSWKEVDDATDRIAAGMLAQGIGRGVRVGLWSLNDLATAYHLIAAMKIGAIPAVVNYSYREFELEGVLWRAQIGHLFIGECKAGSDYVAMAESVRAKGESGLVLHDMMAALAEALAGFSSGAPLARRAALDDAKGKVSPSDVAGITFTSGTTKQPKPVMLTFDNVVNNAVQIGALMRASHDDVLVAPLPFFHSSGITGLLFYALTSGMTAIIHRMFKTEAVLADIDRYKPTVLMVVPSMIELMVQSESFDCYDVSSLRVGLVSGAVVSPAKMRRFIDRLGIPHLLMAYGQTECSPIIASTLYDDDLVTATETVGVPLPHTELRIWDESADRPAPRGVTGEIQVRGFNVMKGYFNYEEENAKKFTGDGWLKTTDAGFLDDRGYLHFSSRISSLIIRHGENISPAEIEAVVDMYCDDVETVKVVGVPDDVTGEAVACLIKTKRSVIDPDDVKRFVKSKIASYKCPKYVFQVDEFPMTATTKISETGCHRLAQELVDRLG